MSITKKQEEGLRSLLASNASYVVGVDEVGYGAWAGPLVVVGAVFKKGWGHPDVKDSKTLSAAKRAAIYPLILRDCIWWVTLQATPEEIDTKGVYNVLQELTKKAAMSCAGFYRESIVVLDGDSTLALPGIEMLAFPKADTLVPAVSAASIVAKVNRDTAMKQLDKVYPGYGFSRNVGYGTPQHQAGLDKLGPSAIHRKSYRPIAKAAADFDRKMKANQEMINQVNSDHGY